MARTDNLENFLTDVAGSIRTKKGTADKIPAANFDAEIASIETGIDTSDATATADDIINPKTAYVNGKKLTGSIILTKKEEGTIAFHEITTNATFSNYNYNNSINNDNLIAITKNATIYIYQLNADYTVTEKCTYTTDTGYSVTTVLLTDGIIVGETKHYLLVYSTLAEGSEVNLPHHYFKELVCKADGTYEILNTAIQGTESDGFHNGPWLANVIARKTSIDTFVIAEIGGGNSSNLFIYTVSPDSNGNFTNNKVRTASYRANRDNITYSWRFLNSNDLKIFCRAGKFGNMCILNLTRGGTVDSQYTFNTSIDSDLFSICYNEDSDKFILAEKVSNIISIYEMTLSSNVLIKGITLGTVSDSTSNKITLDYYKGFLILGGMNSDSWTKVTKVLKLNNSTIEVVNAINSDINSVGFYNTKYTSPNLRIDQDYGYNGSFLVTGRNKSYVANLDVNGTTITGATIYGDTLINSYGTTAANLDILSDKTAYVNNEKVIGTMPNNGELNYMPSTEEQTIPAGYTSGGTIAAVTSSIDTNILAENIKSGVTILGVTGTYTGETTTTNTTSST